MTIEQLIACWRHEALVAGQYSVECAITEAHEHHIAATEAMTLARCADELASLLPQPAPPPHWLLEKVRFALDEARRTISVGHSVRDHIEAVMAEMEYFEMMMAKTIRADIAAPPPPPLPKEGRSLLPQPAERPDLVALVKEASEIMQITYAGNFPAGIESFLVRAAAATATPEKP